MALYKYTQHLGQSQHQAFGEVHGPGATTPHSGLYRCEGCAKEVTCNAGNPLPPQNHHQHTTAQGAIRWRLIVFAQTG